MPAEIISLSEMRSRKKEKFISLKLHQSFEIQDFRREAPVKRLAVVISVELADTLKKMELLE